MVLGASWEIGDDFRPRNHVVTGMKLDEVAILCLVLACSLMNTSRNCGEATELDVVGGFPVFTLEISDNLLLASLQHTSSDIGVVADSNVVGGNGSIPCLRLRVAAHIDDLLVLVSIFFLLFVTFLIICFASLRTVDLSACS